MNSFFELIEEALQKKNISYDEFAKTIGVSLSAVYEWRKPNGYKPKADKLLAISRYLNIPLEELIERQD